MKPTTKLKLILGVGGPIAFIAGFGITYGLGTLCYNIWDKVETYHYYHKKRGL